MLTRVQQYALDRFAKSLLTLADDSLIDAYRQAWEDHRDARAEDNDNLDKACAESLATKKAMRVAFRIINAATSSGTREPARHPFPGACCPDAGRHRRRGGIRPRKSGSHRTHRWREMDSNYWSRHGETPLGRAMWFPRTAPPARRGTDPE